MASCTKRVGLSAAAAIALGIPGSHAVSAMPVNGGLAAFASDAPAVEQVRVVRRTVRRYHRYRYVRPYYWGPRYYAYRPYYYYGTPYGYWGPGYWGPYGYWGPRYYRGPVISFSFGFGPRWGWW